MLPELDQRILQEATKYVKNNDDRAAADCLRKIPTRERIREALFALLIAKATAKAREKGAEVIFVKEPDNYAQLRNAHYETKTYIIYDNQKTRKFEGDITGLIMDFVPQDNPLVDLLLE